MGSRPQPLHVASSLEMAKAEKSDALRRALGRVLRARRGEKLTAGDYEDLGVALGSERGPNASVQAHRLTTGRLFPDQHWEAIAEWAGLTPAGLLREVAAELERDPDLNKKS